MDIELYSDSPLNSFMLIEVHACQGQVFSLHIFIELDSVSIRDRLKTMTIYKTLKIRCGNDCYATCPIEDI